MSDWPMSKHEWLALPAPSSFQVAEYQPYCQEKAPSPPQAQTYTLMQVPPHSSLSVPDPMPVSMQMPTPTPTPSPSQSSPSPRPMRMPMSMPIPMPKPMSMPVPMPMSMPISMPMPMPMLVAKPMPMSMSVPMPRPMPVQKPQQQLTPVPVPYPPSFRRGDTPREMRNKAEKNRRDKLNQSIAQLASMVPPVVASSRKIDKTGVLRLTAHYLRSHQYVFGDSIGQSPVFSAASTRALLNLFKGFLLTITYKGLVVVVSENVKEYLGHTEMDLLGQSIFNITHEDDRKMLKEQLMPKTQTLGPSGELVVPNERDGHKKVADALAGEKRRFIIRLKKHGQRSEPSKYVTCHVEGSLRKSDSASRGPHCGPPVRRARARGENPCTSGNDIVFIGVVRPTKETFINESALESYNMEYRTRHSIDGMIIQCEQRIALVTGYMIHEVTGINAMNFIHREEVRWVIVALQEMYNNHHIFGESCYRLMTKNGQFIYLRTRGRLDVDEDSEGISTFVCTNTLVNEVEGKHLIKLMKEKYNVIVNNNKHIMLSPDGDNEVFDNQTVAVEDPRRIEKVILHLVTNLPLQANDNSFIYPDDDGESPSRRLALIPPKKERIISAIEKIYTVLKTMPKQSSVQVKEIQSPAVTDVPFNEMYLQNQAITDTDVAYNSNVSDFEDFTEIPMSFDTNNQSFVDNSTYQVSDPLLPGPSTAGTKRPIKIDDQEGITRKKIGVTQESNVAKVSSNRKSPPLELLLDEALLNAEIQSALDSLDETTNPNLPDFLISQDVQDFFDGIESVPDGE